MRFAVVGHIEWIEFIRVERVPRQGEIVHARASWREPAGGGAVAAVQIAQLAGSCELFTAVGGEIFQSRTAPGGQIEGVDFQPSPFRMGRSLSNRVVGLLSPYVDVESIAQ